LSKYYQPKNRSGAFIALLFLRYERQIGYGFLQHTQDLGKPLIFSYKEKTKVSYLNYKVLAPQSESDFFA